VATLLVVHHAPTSATGTLLDSVLAGAHDDAIDGVTVRSVPALVAAASDVLGADGILLVTPANFGYMSGALKHFFDSTFLDIGGCLSDGGSPSSTDPREGTREPAPRLPFGLLVHGSYDVTGAIRSVLSLTSALPWRQAAPVLELLGRPGGADRAAAYELGATMAALLA
jgi:hypothetical protein